VHQLENKVLHVCHMSPLLSRVSVDGIATGWTVWGSNPGEGEIFRTRPDRPWGPPSLLCNGHWVSVPGVKRPGRGVDHPLPPSTEVNERVEPYLCSPSGPSGPVLGGNLPYLLPSLLNKYHYHTTVWVK